MSKHSLEAYEHGVVSLSTLSRELGFDFTLALVIHVKRPEVD